MTSIINDDVETIKCPVCNSSYRDHEEIISIKEYPVMIAENMYLSPFQVSICRICGLVFQNPRANAGFYGLYYQKSSQLKRSNYSEGQIMLRKKQVQFIEKYHESKGELLDVGCGTGYYLYLLAKNGWRVAGVEPSKEACDIAKKDFGLEIANCFIEEYDPDKKYDVVSIRHVVEHLHDLGRLLVKAKALLKDNGSIFIEIQDVSLIDQIIISYFYFEHLYYFTPTSLRNILDRYGFKVAAIEQEINPPDSDSPYGVVRIMAKPASGQDKNQPTEEYDEMIGKIRNYFNKLRDRYLKHTNLPKISREFKDGPGIHAIWGASWHTVFINKILHYDLEVEYYIDSDRTKRGHTFLGKPIIAPEDINKMEIEKIMISSQAFEGEIYDQLLKMNYPKKGIYRIYGKQ